MGPFQSDEAERRSGFPGGGHRAAGPEDSVGVKEHCGRKDTWEWVKETEGGVGRPCPMWRDVMGEGTRLLGWLGQRGGRVSHPSGLEKQPIEITCLCGPRLGGGGAGGGGRERERKKTPYTQ